MERYQFLTPALKRRKSSLILIVTILCVLAGGANAQEPGTLSSPLDTKTREQIFEIVWSRVNERYFDPTFGGIDWNLMRRRYQPKTIEAKTDAEFYALLNQMLSELRQSHFGVAAPDAIAPEIPTSEKPATSRPTPDNAPASDSGEGDRNGTAGITVQMVENQPTITHIVAGGAGEAAQLRSGFVITAVNEKSVTSILEGLKKRANDERTLPTYVRLIFDNLLSGPVGSSVTIEGRDSADKMQKVTLARRKNPGVITRFAALPPFPVLVEKRRLPGNIGYIGFNIFLIPILDPVRAAIREMRDADGMIIDLRGNPGGIGAIAPAIAAQFLSEETNLGVMKMRNGEIRFPVFPVEKPFGRPLVILTDEGSVSTSEILAASMQEMGRATIIGSRSAGMALPSQVENLPGGGKLQYAFADFRTRKGMLIEGQGVTPNVPVTLTRAALLSGADPILQTALNYLKTKNLQQAKKRSVAAPQPKTQKVSQP
jgi:carboxyl-terminal processing protease